MNNRALQRHLVRHHDHRADTVGRRSRQALIEWHARDHYGLRTHAPHRVTRLRDVLWKLIGQA